MQARAAVVDHRGDERVLRREVAIERVVREPGRGDDVSDTGAPVGAAGAHDRQRRVEQAPDLLDVAGAALGQRLLRDLLGNAGRHCVL